MVDPLEPAAGLGARLVLAIVVLACLWATVAWALT
jgi:hypothetical protein